MFGHKKYRQKGEDGARSILPCFVPGLLMVPVSGDNSQVCGTLPPDASALSRFLSDLNANHTVLYALLGLAVVAALAFLLSLVTERLMDKLGYRHDSTSKSTG